jgi:hypothetical protein
LEFPGRVYNCKIFSRGYGNEIRAVPDITLFQGDFLHFFSWNSGEGMQFKGIFQGDMTRKARKFQRGM